MTDSLADHSGHNCWVPRFVAWAEGAVPDLDLDFEGMSVPPRLQQMVEHHFAPARAAKDCVEFHPTDIPHWGEFDQTSVAAGLCRMADDCLPEHDASAGVLLWLAGLVKEPEPQGLGAVVRDEANRRWVLRSTEATKDRWECGGVYRDYDRIDVVEILSPGVPA